jgi:hypothetical protein
MKNNVSNSLGKYENYIQEHFIRHDNCGVLFTRLGRNIFRASIDIGDNELTDYKYIVKSKAGLVFDFLEDYAQLDERPLWYKINVDDQAINDYVGIGSLNLNGDWLHFILNYLDKDRAIQGGDTLIILFDQDFTWAVSFTLSQDDNQIIVEKYG